MQVVVFARIGLVHEIQEEINVWLAWLDRAGARVVHVQQSLAYTGGGVPLGGLAHFVVSVWYEPGPPDAGLKETATPEEIVALGDASEQDAPAPLITEADGADVIHDIRPTQGASSTAHS